MATSLRDIRGLVAFGLHYAFMEGVQIRKSSMQFEDITASSNELNYIKNKFGVNKFKLDLSLEDQRYFSDTNIYSVKLSLSLRDLLVKNFWYKKVSGLRVKIIQSGHPYLTNLLLNGPYNDISEIEEKYRIFLKQKIVEVPTSKALSDYRHKEMEDVGDTLCRIPIELEFLANSDHLTYFAFVYSENKPIRSHKTIEKVFDNGNIVRNSSAFYTTEGRVWSGPVHFHPDNGWMGGRRHTKKSHPSLQKADFFNTKIVDLRVFDHLREKQSTIRRTGYGNSPRLLFSELYLSRDKNRAVRGFFAFNPMEFLKVNGEFNSILRYADNKTLLSYARINDIKVIRIKKENKSGLDYDFTDQAGKYDIVAMSADLAKSRLNKNIYYIDNNSDGKLDTLVGGIKEIYLKDMGFKRAFSFYDEFVKDFESSEYGYGVQINMTDPTTIYVKSLLEQLNSALNPLREYYHLASRPGFYNSKTKRFTEKFLDLVSLKYDLPKSLDRNNRSSESSAWRKAARAYFHVLEQLVGPISSTLKSDLVGSMAPSSGGLDGVSMFIQLVEDLIMRVGLPSQVYADHKKNPGLGGNTLAKSLSISHEFSTLFNTSTIKNYGFSYFGDSLIYNSTGLATIGRSEIVSRFRQEADRFGYTIPREGNKDTLKNFYSSLSPIDIDFSAASVNLADMGSVQGSEFLYAAHASVLKIKNNPSARSVSVPEAQTLSTLDASESYSSLLLGVGSGATVKVSAGVAPAATTTPVSGYFSDSDNVLNKEKKEQAHSAASTETKVSDFSFLASIQPTNNMSNLSVEQNYIQAQGTLSPSDKAEEDILFNSVAEIHYISGFDDNMIPNRVPVPVSSNSPYLVLTGVKEGSSFVDGNDIYDAAILMYDQAVVEEGINLAPPEDTSSAQLASDVLAELNTPEDDLFNLPSVPNSAFKDEPPTAADCSADIYNATGAHFVVNASMPNTNTATANVAAPVIQIAPTQTTTETTTASAIGSVTSANY